MRNTPCSRAFKAARQTWNITDYTGHTAAGVMFQVRTEESKAFEQGRVPHDGPTRRAASACRHTSMCAIGRYAESSCITSGGANGCEGELFCHRAPSLCPPAHHSPPRARRVCQELRCQGKSTRFRLKLLSKAARVPELACAAPLGSAQAAARLGEPSRVAACGAHTAAVVHGAALLSM